MSCNRRVALTCNLRNLPTPTPQMLHQAVLAHHPGFFGKPREVRNARVQKQGCIAQSVRHACVACLLDRGKATTQACLLDRGNATMLTA